MSCRRVFVAALFILSIQTISPVPARAQAPGLGRLNGFVTDESGTPVPEVRIQTKTAKGKAIEARTDLRGEWVLAGLGRGVWEIEFVKDGFKPVTASVTIETELSRTQAIRITFKKG